MHLYVLPSEAGDYSEAFKYFATKRVRAMGTGEIRRDNTPILAHEGEKVLTKQETRQNGEKEGIIVNFNGLTIEKEADVDVIMEMMLRKLLKIKANMA